MRPHRAATGYRLWLLTALLCGTALAAPWPDNTRLSGDAFLPPGLLQLQADVGNSPITLWLDKGRALWTERGTGSSCQSCHGPLESLKQSASSFPRLVFQVDE